MMRAIGVSKRSSTIPQRSILPFPGKRKATQKKITTFPLSPRFRGMKDTPFRAEEEKVASFSRNENTPFQAEEEKVAPFPRILKHALSGGRVRKVTPFPGN
jgi:hypothetical protein